MSGVKKMAAALAALFLASTALAQFRMGGGNFKGVWFPEVGSGSVYEVQDKGHKTSTTVAIVGKEDFQGCTGYWLETSMQSEKGAAISKMLMVPGADNKLDIARMIAQMGPDAYEMDTSMMHRNPQQQQS